MTIHSRAIRQFVEQSRVVFRLCALPNGGIVAARPDLPAYPSGVQSYGLVWLRDAAFVCAAAHLVGIHDIQESFYRWLWERAEGFAEQGEVWNVYFPNGAAAGVAPSTRSTPRGEIHLVVQQQWDAVGTLLWAIDEGRRWGPASRTARQVAEQAAAIIVKNWTGGTFKKPSWDVWEERTAVPGKTVHTYSVAMCLAGLERVDAWLPASKARQKAIQSLRRVLDSSVQRGRFVRTVGRTPDTTADMSLLGLVFPAGVVNAEEPVMRRTREYVLRHCRQGAGYSRYPGDKYSGAIRLGRVQTDSVGAWPWLSAWAAIVLHDAGQTTAAQREFKQLLVWSRRGPLPEQIQKDGRPSVAGLAVSHAFAVFAAKRLKLLK